MDLSLRRVRAEKRIWERQGVRFNLASGGEIDVVYGPEVVGDRQAKNDLHAFITRHCRALHALVITNEDEAALARFEFVARERLRGRFSDEVSR